MIYRYTRALVRKANSTDEQILSLIECNNEEVGLKEAKEFSPEVVTCQVKESTAHQGCIMLSPADSEKLLREKTLEAIAAFKAGKIKPLTAENVTFRVEFVERMEPQTADLVAPRTVEVTDNSVEKAFYRMW